MRQLVIEPSYDRSGIRQVTAYDGDKIVGGTEGKFDVIDKAEALGRKLWEKGFTIYARGITSTQTFEY